MALQNIFGPLFTKVAGVSSVIEIGKSIVTEDPAEIFIDAVGRRVPATMRIIDFFVYNYGGAQAGATATLTSNLNGAGDVAVSDALNIAGADAVVHAATIDEVQAVLTPAHAVAEDTLTVVKNAATDWGYATVLAYLL